MVNSLLLLVHFQTGQEGNKTTKNLMAEEVQPLESSARYLS